ncbi:MAG: type II toxin-antitoxin system prevent-host-death family antitoxin [Pedobacter sp.]
MQTVRAADANRHFSNVLKQVSQGEEFLVISRGKPVATIIPVKKADSSHNASRELLFRRLTSQEVTGTRTRSWTRDELYSS